MLEQQMKAAKDGNSSGAPGAAPSNSTPAPPGTGGNSAPAPPGTTPSTNGQGGPPAPGGASQNGQSADYSQQWADHYRSIGKVAEAEAIENYIKQQKVCLQFRRPCVCNVCVYWIKMYIET